MRHRRTLLGLLAVIAALPAWATEGILLRDDILREAAAASAAAVGKAAKGARVVILARQGGWTQVRLANRTGWVRLLSVRADATDPRGSGLESVVALTQARESGKVVAVAGLRGLNEGDLRAAQYNADQMRLLETQAVGTEEARRFAAEAGLTGRVVAHLPGPPKPQASPSPWGESLP